MFPFAAFLLDLCVCVTCAFVLRHVSLVWLFAGYLLYLCMFLASFCLLGHVSCVLTCAS